MDNYITLNNGSQMPMIGLGTWKSSLGKVGPAVEHALLECDYKHIDCASIYNNEKEIGEVFGQIFSGGKLAREDAFVTSKLWNTNHARGNVEIACKQTLRDLQLDYLDLYLIHWGVAVIPGAQDIPLNQRGEPLDERGILLTEPVSVRETWQAMEQLVKAGLVRAIGVANFTGMMLLDLLSYAQVKPAMNQIELHPYNQQARLVEFCNRNNIAVTAYSPLGTPGNARAKQTGEPIILEDKTIVDLAQKYGKSSAQVLLRWAIQRGTVAIPKSVTPENIKNNIQVFDFELSAEEMSTIAGLERGYRFVDPYEWWKIPYFN